MSWFRCILMIKQTVFSDVYLMGKKKRVKDDFKSFEALGRMELASYDMEKTGRSRSGRKLEV